MADKEPQGLKYKAVCLECVPKTWEGKTYNSFVFLCEDGGVRNVSSSDKSVSPMDLTSWDMILRGNCKVGTLVLEAYLFKGKTQLRYADFRLD